MPAQRPAPPARPRSDSPEIARFKSALDRRATVLSEEAASETQGTMKYILAARLAHELKELSKLL